MTTEPFLIQITSQKLRWLPSMISSSKACFASHRWNQVWCESSSYSRERINGSHLAICEAFVRLCGENLVYSRFQGTFHCKITNFVAKFGNSLRSSKVHFRIRKPVCKLSTWLASLSSGANHSQRCQIMNKVHRFVSFLTSKWTFHEQQDFVNISWTFHNSLNYFVNFNSKHL